MPFTCYLIYFYLNNMLDHDGRYYNPRIIGIITKHELVEWLCIDLTLAWLWVRTLVDPN